MLHIKKFYLFYLVPYFYLLLPLNISSSFRKKSWPFCLSSISAFRCLSNDSRNITSNFLFCSRWYFNCPLWKTSNLLASVFVAFFFIFVLFFFFQFFLSSLWINRHPIALHMVLQSIFLFQELMVWNRNVITAKKRSHYCITVLPKNVR